VLKKLRRREDNQMLHEAHSRCNTSLPFEGLPLLALPIRFPCPPTHNYAHTCTCASTCAVTSLSVPTIRSPSTCLESLARPPTAMHTALVPLPALPLRFSCLLAVAHPPTTMPTHALVILPALPPRFSCPLSVTHPPA